MWGNLGVSPLALLPHFGVANAPLTGIRFAEGGGSSFEPNSNGLLLPGSFPSETCDFSCEIEAMTPERPRRTAHRHLDANADAMTKPRATHDQPNQAEVKERNTTTQLSWTTARKRCKETDLLRPHSRRMVNK